MDSEKFANLTRGLSDGLTRRSALGAMVVGALAAVGGGAIQETTAKRRRGKRKNKSRRPVHFRKPGEFCDNNSQCNFSKHYVCEVAFNASNSDKTCCGATGAVCGPPDGNGDATAPFCCAGFDCISGTCQPVPNV
jgi:hypothetical protein